MADFTKISRPYVWVFLFFSLVHFFNFILYSIKWKQIARKYLKKTYRLTYINDSADSSRFKNLFYYRLRKMYDDKLGTNGTHYLYKLFGYEIVESLVQITNIVTVYTCLLSMSWVLMVTSILLCNDLFRTFYLCSKKRRVITVTERNSLILLDVMLTSL